MRVRVWTLAVAAFLSIIGLPGTGHAAVISCGWLEGEANGVTVSRLDLTYGGSGLRMAVDGQPKINGVVDESNYYFTDGIQIINARSGALHGWYVAGNSGPRPTVLITSGDQTIIDRDLVGPQVPLGWDNPNNPGSLAAGSYYIVAFGFGSGTYREYLDIGAVGTCQPVTPGAAELIQFDQTDFKSSGQDLRTSGQAYAMGVGGGGNLTHSFSTNHRFFAGYLQTGFSWCPYFGCDSYLKWKTPTFWPTWQTLKWGHSQPLADTAGTYSFQLKYSGLVYQQIHIDGWDLDLPVV